MRSSGRINLLGLGRGPPARATGAGSTVLLLATGTVVAAAAPTRAPDAEPSARTAALLTSGTLAEADGRATDEAAAAGTTGRLTDEAAAAMAVAGTTDCLTYEGGAAAALLFFATGTATAAAAVVAASGRATDKAPAAADLKRSSVASAASTTAGDLQQRGGRWVTMRWRLVGDTGFFP